LLDLDEFEVIIQRGIFAPELGERLMAEALRVIDDIEHRRSPFDQPWPTWRPDRSSAIPLLRDNWHEVHD
jgi:hypothetical protein